MKKSYILAFCLIFGAIGYLAFATIQENKVYFLNVSEALAMGKNKIKQARLFGLVSKRDFHKTKGGLEVSFLLMDKKNPQEIIPVFYQGALPDTFKPGVEVIVEGKMDKDKFIASSIITKCPSKYKKKQG